MVKKHLYPFNTWMRNSEEGLECLLYSEYNKDQAKKMIPVQVWVFSGLWTVMDKQQMQLEPVLLSTFRTTSSRYRSPSSINAQLFTWAVEFWLSHTDKCTSISLFFLLTWADLKRFSFQAVNKVFLLKGKLFIKVFDSISCFPFFTLVLNSSAAELSTNVSGLIKMFIRTALFLTAFAECFTWEMKNRKKKKSRDWFHCEGVDSEHLKAREKRLGWRKHQWRRRKPRWVLNFIRRCGGSHFNWLQRRALTCSSRVVFKKNKINNNTGVILNPAKAVLKVTQISLRSDAVF